jgi:hypothetical protein
VDLSSSIRSFAKPVTLVRCEASVPDGYGHMTPGASSELAREMLAVPATARDLQVLPEGLRTEQTMMFFDTQDLRSVAAVGQPADRVLYGGSTYELQHVYDWSEQAGYWQALGVKVEQ